MREDTSGNGDTLNHEVRNVQVGGGWQSLGQEGENLVRLVRDLDDGSGSGTGDGGDKEDLNNLEAEVGILREKLNLRERGETAQLTTPAHDDGDQRHENG